MDEKKLKQASRFMSKILRHSPERAGLTLQPGGWVPVGDLLIALYKHGYPILIADLVKIVQENDKQRFSFNDDNSLIRANQGHSVEVDLQLEEKEPPVQLYHGTALKNFHTILKEGISKMKRQHVHLSTDVDTALKVGERHGDPGILVVDSAAMYKHGFKFYLSDNGVWLCDSVPPHFIIAKGFYN